MVGGRAGGRAAATVARRRAPRRRRGPPRLDRGGRRPAGRQPGPRPRRSRRRRRRRAAGHRALDGRLRRRPSAAGMAVRIPAAEVAGGLGRRRRPAPRTRCRLGPHPVPTPPGASARLLTHHAYTDGLSAITPGTPTNVTAAGRPGRAPTDARLVAALDPERRPSADAVAGTAADRLYRALGLPLTTDDLLPAVPGADGRSQETEIRLADALWESTLGSFLSDVLRPVVPGQPEPAAAGPRPRAPVPGRAVPGAARLAAALRRAARGRRRLRARPDRTRRGRAARRPGQAADLLGAGGPERPPPRPHRRPRRRPRRPAPDHAARGGRPVPHRPRAAHGQLDRAASTGTPWRSSTSAACSGSTSASRRRRRGTSSPSTPATSAATGPLVAGTTAGPARRDRRAGPDERQLRRGSRRGRTRSPPSWRRWRSTPPSASCIAPIWPPSTVSGSRRASSTRCRSSACCPGTSTSGSRPPARCRRAASGSPRPAEASRVVIPGVTGPQTVRAFVTDRLAGGDLPTTWRRFGGCSTSLDGLSSRPPDELDRALRGLLDAYSHRLDAWYTSLATRRLAALRVHHPGRGAPRRRTAGSTTCARDRRRRQPRLRPRAVAAAGGHRRRPAQRPPGPPRRRARGARDRPHRRPGPDRADPARRRRAGPAARRAARLPVRARGARPRRDASRSTSCRSAGWRRCGRTAQPPLRPRTSDHVAARDVVDGVALLERWRTEGPALFDALQQLVKFPPPPAEVFVMPPQEQRNQLAVELDRLADSYDAVADLLLAETVHQNVLGQPRARRRRARRAGPPGPPAARSSSCEPRGPARATPSGCSS